MAPKRENPFLKPECGSTGGVLNYRGEGGVLNVITVSLEEEDKVKKGSWKGDVMTEAEVGMMYFENGGRGHKPRNTSGHQKPKRQGLFLQTIQKESALPTPGL